MRTAIAKYLYWEEGYTIRQTAIIAELSEDYVRKVVKGEKGVNIAASYEGMTEGMVLRKSTIDAVMRLDGYDIVPNDMKYSYISLLGYMGFTASEVRILFPFDEKSFINNAVLRSGQAWRKLDSSILGIPQYDYNFTFIDKNATYAAEKAKQDAALDGEIKYRQEQRKNKKLEKLKKFRENK